MKLRSVAIMLLALLPACESKNARRERLAKEKAEKYTFEQTLPAPVPGGAENDAGAPLWNRGDAGAPALTLLAGARGGTGALDGVGDDARIGRVTSMVTADFRTLYFADATFHTLRTLDAVTREVRTVAGVVDAAGAEDGPFGKARLFGPGGLAMDGANGVFIADRGNHTIRRFDVAKGSLETVAGAAGMRGGDDGPAASARFDYPSAVAFVAPRLFVADTGGKSLRVIDVAQRTVSTLKTDLAFLSPIGLAVGRADELFVSDSLLDGVYSVKISTGETRLLAGVGAFGYPAHRDGVGNEARLFEPRELSFDAARNLLFVDDEHNAAIRQIDLASGAVTTTASFADVRRRTDGELGTDPVRPRALLLDDKRRFLFSDGGEIRALTPQSKAVEVLAGRRRVGDARDGLAEHARFGEIGGLALDEGGNLLVGDCQMGRLRRVDARTAGVETLTVNRMTEHGPRDVSTFGCPSGIAPDGRGNIIVADRARAALYNVRISPPNVTVIAGSPRICDATDGPFESARFCNPVQVVYDQPTNQVYVTDGSAHTIRRVDLPGRTVSTLAGKAFERGHADAIGSAARFAQPSGMALGARGRLYVADRDNHCIRAIDVATGAVVTVAGRPGVRGDADGALLEATFDEPTDLRASASGEQLFVVDRRAIHVVDLVKQQVRKIVRSREGIGLRFGPLPTSMHTPSVLLPMPNGAIVVADSGEGVLAIATGW